MSNKEGISSKLSDLEDLDKRLRKARGVSQDEQDQSGRGAAMGMAMRFASELVAGVLVGLAIGWGLDRLFDTAPIFILVFFILGTAAGILNVVRTSQRVNAEQAEAQRQASEKHKGE